MRKEEGYFENSYASVSVVYTDYVAEKRGKVSSFTEKENRAMSHVLKTLTEQNKWTQAEAGLRVDVNQQNAGKLINGQAGFSRPTAVRLAALCGFDSPETMLRELGAKAEVKDAPKGWNERDIAVGAMRRAGYPETAIEAVVAQYATSEYANRKSRWWADRIVARAAEMDAAQVEAPPSTSMAAAEPPKTEAPRSVRKRAKTG